MRTIEQFMWGFQYIFRFGLEFRAARTFDEIDFGASPRAYLIGFATRPDLTFPVCFESENDPLAQVDFSGVEELADQLFHANPESELIISYRPLHDRQQEALWDLARASALKETLERSPAGGDRYFFVGRSGIV